MSVEFLEDSCGFTGFRVRRRVDGQQFQEYFSFNIDGRWATKREETTLREQAYTLDRRLKIQQQAARDKRDNRFWPTARSKTGTKVKGIFFCERRDRNRDGTYSEPIPVFQVSVWSDADKKPVSRQFRIHKFSNRRAAWIAAVKYFACHKLVDNYRFLINRYTPIKQGGVWR